jgi:hypothetical protein
MRAFVALLLAAILCLPTIAAASNGTFDHGSSITQWALFGGKNAKKAKKTKKAKRSKQKHRAKSGLLSWPFGR